MPGFQIPTYVSINNFDSLIDRLSRPTTASARKTMLWTKPRMVYEREFKEQSTIKDTYLYWTKFRRISKHYPGTRTVTQGDELRDLVDRLSKPTVVSTLRHGSTKKTNNIAKQSNSKNQGRKNEFPRTSIKRQEFQVVQKQEDRPKTAPALKDNSVCTTPRPISRPTTSRYRLPRKRITTPIRTKSAVIRKPTIPSFLSNSPEVPVQNDKLREKENKSPPDNETRNTENDQENDEYEVKHPNESQENIERGDKVLPGQTDRLVIDSDRTTDKTNETGCSVSSPQTPTADCSINDVQSRPPTNTKDETYEQSASTSDFSHEHTPSDTSSFHSKSSADRDHQSADDYSDRYSDSFESICSDTEHDTDSSSDTLVDEYEDTKYDPEIRDTDADVVPSHHAEKQETPAEERNGVNGILNEDDIDDKNVCIPDMRTPDTSFSDKEFQQPNEDSGRCKESENIVKDVENTSSKEIIDDDDTQSSDNTKDKQDKYTMQISGSSNMLSMSDLEKSDSSQDTNMSPSRSNMDGADHTLFTDLSQNTPCLQSPDKYTTEASSDQSHSDTNLSTIDNQSYVTLDTKESTPKHQLEAERTSVSSSREFTLLSTKDKTDTFSILSLSENNDPDEPSERLNGENAHYDLHDSSTHLNSSTKTDSDESLENGDNEINAEEPELPSNDLTEVKEESNVFHEAESKDKTISVSDEVILDGESRLQERDHCSSQYPDVNRDNSRSHSPSLYSQIGKLTPSSISANDQHISPPLVDRSEFRDDSIYYNKEVSSSQTFFPGRASRCSRGSRKSSLAGASKHGNTTPAPVPQYEEIPVTSKDRNPSVIQDETIFQDNQSEPPTNRSPDNTTDILNASTPVRVDEKAVSDSPIVVQSSTSDCHPKPEDPTEVTEVSNNKSSSQYSKDSFVDDYDDDFTHEDVLVDENNKLDSDRCGYLENPISVNEDNPITVIPDDRSSGLSTQEPRTLTDSMSDIIPYDRRSSSGTLVDVQLTDELLTPEYKLRLHKNHGNKKSSKEKQKKISVDTRPVPVKKRSRTNNTSNDVTTASPYNVPLTLKSPRAANKRSVSSAAPKRQTTTPRQARTTPRTDDKRMNQGANPQSSPKRASTENKNAFLAMILDM